MGTSSTPLQANALVNWYCNGALRRGFATRTAQLHGGSLAVRTRMRKWSLVRLTPHQGPLHACAETRCVFSPDREAPLRDGTRARGLSRAVGPGRGPLAAGCPIEAETSRVEERADSILTAQKKNRRDIHRKCRAQRKPIAMRIIDLRGLSLTGDAIALDVVQTGAAPRSSPLSVQSVRGR